MTSDELAILIDIERAEETYFFLDSNLNELPKAITEDSVTKKILKKRFPKFGNKELNMVLNYAVSIHNQIKDIDDHHLLF